MKPIITLALLAILIFSFKNEAVETITLSEALDRKIVTVAARGTGNYRGGSVALKIESLVAGDYNIKVEAGYVFRANDPHTQDQLIVDEIILDVKGKSQKLYTVNGFCCEKSNSAPFESTIFKYMKMNRPELVKLCALTNTKKFDNGTLQNAVWAVSDNYDVSTIYNRQDPRVTTLRKNICILTNQEDTWYNKQAKVTVAPDHSIITEPMTIEAVNDGLRVPLTVGERTFSYKVYNADDELKSDRKMQMTVKASATYTLKFNLRVTGWEKGTYKVDMFVDEDKIHNYEFEV